MGLQEQFDSITEDSIEQFVRDHAVEDLHLDFKSQTDFTKKEHRKNLAKFISGFANADGGLIVWGVRCKPSEDSGDVADAVEPIGNFVQFRDALIRYSADAVNPSVTGVDHKFFPFPTGDLGTAITLVPPGEAGPYMAKFGEDRYFRRHGNQTLRMEHFEIADMFGRRPHADLSPYVVVVDGTDYVPHQGQEWMNSLVVGIENLGRGSAVAPFLGIKLDSSAGYRVNLKAGLDGRGSSGLPPLPRSRNAEHWHYFGGTASHVIPPGVRFDVCVVNYTRNVADGHALPQFQMEYQIAALESPLGSGHIELSRDKINSGGIVRILPNG